MTEFTKVEKHQALTSKKAQVAIRPYTEQLTENMGLETYQMVVFEGVFHEEQLTCLENNGIKRYVTGLNEFAPEVKMIADPDVREAVIKDIRTTVAQLERELASNIVDPADKDFWNNVKLLKPDNSVFWDTITLRVSNDPMYLTPETNPYHLITIKAIEAGGFSLISKSLEDVRKNPTMKFYLDRHEETISLRTEVKKIRNKALAELEKLYNKNINKLFYICKVIDANSTQYKKSTPTDILYDNMDKYINGESVEKDKKKTAQHFLDITSMDMETLKIRSIIKDANFYKVIGTKADGHIYHLKTSTLMGKNTSDVLEWLRNPLNETILDEIMKNVEKFWNN